MKTLSVGIGCRLGSSAEAIEAAVRAALGPHAIERIRAVASIDTKAGETGLLEFCARHALPLLLFSREQIAGMPVAQPSAAVREHLGVDGVCEPCALLAAAWESDALVAATGPGTRAARTAPEMRVGPAAASAAAAALAPAGLAIPATPNLPSATAAPTAPTTANAFAACLVVSKTHHAGVTVAIATTADIAADAAADAGHEPSTHAPHRQDLR